MRAATAIRFRSLFFHTAVITVPSERGRDLMSVLERTTFYEGFCEESHEEVAVVRHRYNSRRKILRTLNWVPDEYRRLAAAVVCPREGLRIVEFGSGWGANVPHLSERTGQRGRVMAVELAENSHAFARRRYRSCTNVEFINASMFECTVPANMDTVFFSFSYCIRHDKRE